MTKAFNCTRLVAGCDRLVSRPRIPGWRYTTLSPASGLLSVSLLLVDRFTGTELGFRGRSSQCGTSAMTNHFCETCNTILALKLVALEDFAPVGCPLLTTTSQNFEQSAEQGCTLCLLYVSVFGARKIADMRRRLLENQSLPEDRKYETIFTVFGYGSGQMLLEVSQSKRGEQVPVRQNKSVLKLHHSGIMLLFPGKLIIRLLVHFPSGLTI